jgi:hypothetical protein
MKPLAAVMLGVLTGSVAAACFYVPMPEFPAVALFGQCVGGVRVLGACGGLSLSIYSLPGLVFGVAVGVALWRAGRLRPAQAVGFALAATVANALAVVATLTANDPIAPLLGRASLAGTGAIGGAVGGGLLAASTARWLAHGRWPLLAVVGAMLGLLLPIIDSAVGEAIFYIVWQAGYAACLAASLPAYTRSPPLLVQPIARF